MFYIFSYFQQTKSKTNNEYILLTSIACVASAMPLLYRNYYQDSESTAMLASRVLSLAYSMLTNVSMLYANPSPTTNTKYKRGYGIWF